MSSSLRILYAAFDPVPFPKGASQRITATVKALTRSGASVFLVTPKVPTPSGISADFTSPLQDPPLLQHIQVDLPTGQDNFLTRIKVFRHTVARCMNEYHWDAIWYRSIWEGIPALRYQVYRVYEVHGFPSIELPYHFPRLAEHLNILEDLITEENRLLSGSTLLLTPSRTGRTYLLSRGVPTNKIMVIPNSIDRTSFPHSPPPLPPGPPWRLVYSGTLAPWQGVETLIEAVALLKKRIEVNLHVIGPRKGLWIRSLKRKLKLLRLREQVIFHGAGTPAQVRNLIYDSHLCVAPLPDNPRNSLQGCCPIKLLEYMACGRPVISTNIRPVQEIITHRQNGWLIEPGSPLALSEAIYHLLHEPALLTELGENAHQEIISNWSRDNFHLAISQLLQLIQNARVPNDDNMPNTRPAHTAS